MKSIAPLILIEAQESNNNGAMKEEPFFLKGMSQ